MKDRKEKKVIVVMPAYFAEKTLEKTYNDIPKEYVDEIILVDDASKDKTVEIAKKLGLKVIVHEKNKGYGGNQKTCYTAALKDKADIIVLVHPDYIECAKSLENKADVVYGSRMLIKGDAKKGKMPWWKRIGNRALTLYFDLFLKIKITDAATGYIAYSKKVLETIPFMRNSNGMTFDEEAMIQIVSKKFRVAEIPIPTRYEDVSSSTTFPACVKYGLKLFWRVIKYKILNKT